MRKRRGVVEYIDIALISFVIPVQMRFRALMPETDRASGIFIVIVIQSDGYIPVPAAPVKLKDTAVRPRAERTGSLVQTDVRPKFQLPKKRLP
jgi:hypothetical protein